MICPKCGAKIVGRRRHCDNCGADIAALDRLRKLSNRLYNEGLEMASVRNLTGAVEKLRKSLELNKENIEARNLLGLVYYELGESTNAICEWVISTNLKKEENDAERLLKLVQADAAEYQNVNAAVRKFNMALELAKNGNEDMAVITLKKVISFNPHYVKAHLLLALIYIKNCEYERAKKLLKHILKIDVGNVTARRYINEIKLTVANVGRKQESSPAQDDYDYTGTGSSKGRIYTDDKPNFLSVITFFIGLAVGVALIYAMAVPSIKSDLRRSYEEKERMLGADVSAANAEKSSLESRIRILENENTDLKSRLLVETTEPVVEEAPDYAPFLQLYTDYLNLCDEVIFPATSGKLIDEEGLKRINAFNGRLIAFDMSSLEDENAKGLYATMAEMIGTYATGTGEEPEATPTPTPAA